MKSLQINLPGREYEIHIQHGLLEKAGSYLRKISAGNKATIVTDSNVGPLYAGTVTESLKKEGFSVQICQVPAGEESKCQEQLFRLYDEMLDFGMTRSDLVVALGGGVVGDLTGYAAATLLRGIPFVQIPTTILSQVDSSVGGKVAIDLPKGKNLVGAFYQPKMVLIDPLCLKTLPDRNIADGMAEVIKYGAIGSAELFSFLEEIKSDEELFAKIDKIVYTCCDMKRKVVEEDELDTGGRMVLNFGHTFGHAIEKEYHYQTYTHGEAVAIGMVMACEYGENHGITEPGTGKRMEQLLQSFRLPTRVALSKESLMDAISVDKKGSGNEIHLILLTKIGEVKIIRTGKEDVLQ
ncbi:MAG: 3-dehydroquinate synthase [Clostridia bacterium]|nr:3-dehydroquinate synthase [Clostridia bacterium]